MLLGRDGELADICALLAEDRPVVVTGESGAGKTTLLREAASTASRRVFEGGGLGTLSWMDHLPLRRALGERFVPGDAARVARNVEAVVGPGVLLLDDLQWSDTATMEVVALLVDRIALLTAVRRGDPGAGATLERLSELGFVEVPVEPLDRARSIELVRMLRPDLSSASAQRLVARAGGNPLLLHELAATGEPSASLRLALAARLRQLDQTARQAFALLALAGRPLDVDVLGAASARALSDAGLAVADGDAIAVRHGLLAEVAAAELPDAERRSLHALLARRTSDRGEAARHHVEAGERDLAYGAALEAAQLAERPGERARHLALAATLASGPHADALRLDAARALDEANDWPGVVRVLDDLGTADPETRAWAALLRARGAWVAGDADALRNAIAEGLALVDRTGTEIEVRLRIEASRIPIFVDSDPATGVRRAEEALALARATGVDVPRAEYLLGTALSVFDAPGAEEHLQAAIDGARDAGDRQTEFVAANNLVSFHESAGSPARGRALAVAMAQRAADLRLGYWEHGFEAMAANLDFHAGAYAEVLTATEQLLVEPIDARTRDMLVELHCLALVDVGRVDEAVRKIEAAQGAAVPDYRGREQLVWVLAEAALWGRQPARALELATRYLEAGLPGDPNIPLGYVTHAWASVDLGRAPDPPAPAQERPFLRAVPVETSALTHLFGDEAARAAELFADAAALWAQWHRRGELRCLWAQGESLRRAGDVSRAITVLSNVEERAESLGMIPLLARIQRSLRAAGVRRSAPRSVTTGGLTGREHEVLQLVATGLTNAEIAARLGTTRRTVVSQVASASAKLGAASRAQAAVMATAR